ncbi:MAG TPA: hypothetical protein VFY45_14265 [Baekduia sp.]|nr:hypothetical protein [Baekduia sp.]
MTRHKLNIRIGFVVVTLVVLLIAAVLLKAHGVPKLSNRQEDRWYDFGKDLFPLVVAVLATFLASWFQQRATFIESLRRLWSLMVDAKVDLMRYCNGTDRTRERYEQAYLAISRAIDEVRTVYRNVGESSSEIGRYPWEPLHDMRRALDQLGHGDYDEAASKRAEDLMEQAWNALRPKVLAEFQPPEPTDPILQRGAHDERRGPPMVL